MITILSKYLDPDELKLGLLAMAAGLTGLVASVNALAFIAVYYFISKEFQPEEEENREEKGKEKEEQSE